MNDPRVATRDGEGTVERLENVVQPYAWGSREAIARLQGRPVPSPGPEAELWLGAHPLAPSRVCTPRGVRTLAERIADAPDEALGPRVLHTFGPTLPFLLKVLAAEQPLSLQAHPNLAQAREGFAREEAAGIPRDAASRSYRDANHKPELICALTPFDALCGFRSPRELLDLFAAIDVKGLENARNTLSRAPDPEGLRAVFTGLFALNASERRALVDAVVAACGSKPMGPFADDASWTQRFAALYPGDIGVVVALMLRRVRLAPGEALYLPAGNLHAYLHGVGIEVMASSDNVLRGGLTPKHVELAELLSVLVFRDEPVSVIHARVRDGVQVYDTPAREFELSTARVTADGVRVSVTGPEIVLCTEGAFEATRRDERIALARGESLFVPADTVAYTLRGDGTVFRASVPLDD